MFKSEERITYQTLKDWALEAHFDGCRDLAIREGWQPHQIHAYVSYAFEDGFEKPVENLMWNFILLVLSGGWNKTYEGNARARISAIIDEYGLNELLSNVPAIEAESFSHDLRILKMI